MNRTLLTLSLIAVALTATEYAHASGSAPNRAPRPPHAENKDSADKSLDNARYALGKAVFNGKAKLVANPRAEKTQRARLQIQAVRAGGAGKNLPQLAGRLTEQQLDALEYYVANRFR